MDIVTKSFNNCIWNLQALQKQIEDYMEGAEEKVEMLKRYQQDTECPNITGMLREYLLTSLNKITYYSNQFNKCLQHNNLNSEHSVSLFQILKDNTSIKINTNPFLDNIELDDSSSGRNERAELKDTEAYIIPYGRGESNILPAEESRVTIADDHRERIFKFKRKDLLNYKPNDTFHGAVMELGAVDCFVIDIDDPDAKLIKDLCEKKHLRQYVGMPGSGEVFGVVVEEGLIMRAVCDSNMDRDKEAIEMSIYLLDTGEILQISHTDLIYHIDMEYQQIPAQAMACKLDGITENGRCLDKKEIINIAEKLLYKKAFFCISDIQDSTLFIHPIEADNVNSKNTSGNAIGNSSDNANAFSNGLNEEDLKILYEEPLNTSNAMKAVLGYDPQDDKRICPHYDPKIGGCFKGVHCRRDHELMNPEGYTKDLCTTFTILNNHEPTIRFKNGQCITILPTYADHLDRFYAQIISGQETPPLIWNDKELTNKQSLKKLPLINDLLLAKYVDNYWYRAMVLDVYEADRKIRVFYVDYGNQQTLDLHDLKPYDQTTANVPFQATLCRLADVIEAPLTQEIRAYALGLLRQCLCNKSCDVQVVSHHDMLIVKFLDQPFSDIPLKLINMGALIETKTVIV